MSGTITSITVSLRHAYPVPNLWNEVYKKVNYQERHQRYNIIVFVKSISLNMSKGKVRHKSEKELSVIFLQGFCCLFAYVFVSWGCLPPDSLDLAVRSHFLCRNSLIRRAGGNWPGECMDMSRGSVGPQLDCRFPCSPWHRPPPSTHSQLASFSLEA